MKFGSEHTTQHTNTHTRKSTYTKQKNIKKGGKKLIDSKNLKGVMRELMSKFVSCINVN